jgi:hypothetical protein
MRGGDNASLRPPRSLGADRRELPSRNTVPDPASSNRPLRSLAAPVNAPRT